MRTERDCGRVFDERIASEKSSLKTVRQLKRRKTSLSIGASLRRLIFGECQAAQQNRATSTQFKGVTRDRSHENRPFVTRHHREPKAQFCGSSMIPVRKAARHTCA